MGNRRCCCGCPPDCEFDPTSPVECVNCCKAYLQYTFTLAGIGVMTFNAFDPFAFDPPRTCFYIADATGECMGGGTLEFGELDGYGFNSGVGAHIATGDDHGGLVAYEWVNPCSTLISKCYEPITLTKVFDNGSDCGFPATGILAPVIPP